MKIDFAHLDRRFIYLLVLLALCLPLLYRYSVKPARMKGAETFFEIVQNIDAKTPGIAFVAMDFGPGTSAENVPQAEVVFEHLMRRRIPVAVFSLYVLSEPFLQAIPERVARRLTAEHPGQTWEYGKDWVNLGYRPGGYLLVQSIPKSENFAELFKRDVRGNNLSDLPAFKHARKLEDIKLLAEFTGLVGMFDTYVQFFQKKTYRPIFGHGCTSITIPEAYIYVDSGQLSGLLEGVAGAAWYSVLLKEHFPGRVEDTSAVINTGLGVAHVVVIVLILFGNFAGMLQSKEAEA